MVPFAMRLRAEWSGPREEPLVQGEGRLEESAVKELGADAAYLDVWRGGLQSLAGVYLIAFSNFPIKHIVTR